MDFIQKKKYIEWKQKENILEKLVKENLNEDWNYIYLSMNPNISFEFIQNYFPNENINSLIACNPNITWDIVKENPNIPWNYNCLSQNPNITWDIVRNNIDKDWNYIYLSQNPNITLDIMNNNRIFPIGHRDQGKKIGWDFFYKMYCNSHITWNTIKKDFDIREYDIYQLSYHPVITWDIIKENNTFLDGQEWNYQGLSMNPNITWDIIRNNPDKPWDMKDNIFLNPNITLENIKELKYINYQLLSNNRFMYNDIVFQKNYKVDVEKRRKEFRDIFLSLNHPTCIPDISNIIEGYIEYD